MAPRENVIEINPLRWYSLREVLAFDEQTSAILALPEVRAAGGCYGACIINRIRARGERVIWTGGVEGR